MSLALSPVLAVKGATAADASPAKLVVGFDSGAVHVYARDDPVLERSFAAGRARVDAVQWVPNTDLVAVVCNSRCNVYNLATRRLETAVDTRSARLVRAHALPHGGRLAVGSTYKLRLLDFAPDSSLVHEALLAAPDKHKLAALEVWNRDVYVVFGSRPKLYRAERASAQFLPLAMLHPSLGSPRRFVTAAAGGVMFIGGSSAAQLLDIGVNHEAPRVVGVLEHLRASRVAAVDSESTNIPLFCAALSNATLALMNPHTGTILSKISSSAHLVPSRAAPMALGDNTVFLLNCDLSLDFITQLSTRDLREAATLALSLGPEHTVDDRVRSIQQRYATHVFEQGDDEHIATAMRLFMTIEEQEQNCRPSNHFLVVKKVIKPFIDQYAQNSPGNEAADSQETHSTVAQSVFSARTTPRRKHVLDPIVSYLVYARRHLRLAGYQADSADVDTTLFQCYMLMHSPLVAPLLRSPNHCDPAVVKDLLLAAGKWRELVWFLRSKQDPQQHREALDLLVQHNEPPKNIISYLEQAHTEQSIVFEYAKPLLSKEPFLAQHVFFEDTSYNSWDVYNYLLGINNDMAAKYALYRVNHGDNEHAELHEAVARLLAPNEAELIEFLNKSTKYRASALVQDPQIPARARALLHSKMHQHKEAINLYLDPLHDFDAARREAEQHSLASYLFDQLKDSEHLGYFLNNVSADKDLAFSYALERLPTDTPLKDLAPFCTRFLGATESKKNRLELTEAFSRVALTDYSLQLMDLRKARYVVTPTSACAVCHKRLGQAVMGILAGEMVHYGCLERQKNQPASLNGQ